MHDITYSLSNVKIDFGYEDLFGFSNLSIYSGERVAIIGDNGSGKTTLLKILSKQLEATEGHVKCFTDCSYIPQLYDSNDEKAGEKDYDLLSNSGLLDKNLGSYSAGEKTLNKVLNAISEAKATMILDEPTTYLDEDSIKKMISTLKFMDNTLVFVSHNIEFINALADKIWVIENNTVNEYYGNYNDYLKVKEIELIEHTNKRRQYENKKKHLETVIENKSKQAIRATKVTTKKKNKSIKPNRLASTKQKDTVQKRINSSMKAAQKRIDMLEDVQEVTEKRKVVYPDVQFACQNASYPIMLDDLILKIEDRILLDQVSIQIKNGSKICIKGKNGSGKSTLFKHIYNRDDNVIVSSTSKFAYFHQHNQLEADNESIYNMVKNLDYMPDHFINAVLINLGFDYRDLKRQINTLSGGEKIRLKLATLFLKESNVMLLDEPTTFLDITTKEALGKMIKDYPGTVLFISHDNSFINDTADYIYSIEDQQLKQVK